MDERQRTALLTVARRALEHSAVGGPEPDPEPTAPDALVGDVELPTHHGAFVSLHTRSHDLRGCVGCLSSDRRLDEVVWDMAEGAARRDPRFPGVRVEEVDGLVIEISVLEPSTPVAALDEVDIGRDGLLVVGPRNRGVLLPQVATEHGWDAETFADQTCVKARMPPGSWREPGVQLYRFAAEVFSEARP
jgi:AmmeMemoRadiSam system protein A